MTSPHTSAARPSTTPRAPAIRAFAITSPNRPGITLTEDLGRANAIAPYMHGQVHALYSAQALADMLLTDRVAMNSIEFDPSEDHCTGSIEHLHRCLAIAYAEALTTVRRGALAPDASGTWHNVAPLLDATTHDADAITRHKRHLSVALFARLVERHPEHPLWLGVIVTAQQVAA